MKRNWIWLAVCVSIMITGCGPAPLTAEVLDPDQGLTNAPALAPTNTTLPATSPSSPAAVPTLDLAAVTVRPLTSTVIPSTPEIIAVTPLPTAVPPPDAASQTLIEKAKADLAKRLGIDSSQIALIEFRTVIWPDGSLGCPQPGMAYTQVLVEGYFIRLGVSQHLFEYHGGQNGDPFLCENPDKSLPPPSDTGS